MLKFIKGDMWKHLAGVRVNTVNCKGVMGKGVALEFKQRYPQSFQWYREQCLKNRLGPGQILMSMERGTLIIHFATKNHWKNPSRYEWIESGLKVLRKLFMTYDTDPVVITVPALGCDNGGLDWEKVKPLIQQAFSDLPDPCLVLVFEPTPQPSADGN